MQSHRQIRYDVTSETDFANIRKLINLSLAPVSNTPILDGDLEGFMNLVCQHPDLELVLSNLNPDNIIRGFFPSVQLSQKKVEFLKKCTIVIRSKEGVFQYPHQRGQRTRHELRVSFLGLFLLAYYDVNLRIFSVPKVEEGWNNIGYWGRIADELEARCARDMGKQTLYVNSSIDIIPPQGSDLSSILEDASQIYTLANKFELNTLRDELLPIRQKSFKELEASINRAIAAMPMSIVEVVDQLSNHSHKLNERDAEDLQELIANSFPQDFLAANFIRQEKNSVKLSLDPTRLNDKQAKDYAIFYTAFFFMMLYAYAKNNEEMIAHKAQATPYKGNTELLFNNENFEQWLCGIFAATDIQLDTLFDNSLQRLGNVIEQHGTYLWTLLHRSFSIPNSIFKEILQSKAFLTVKQGLEEIALFRQKAKEMNFYKHMSTVELVRFILDDSTEPHPHKSAYIRKLFPGKDKEIDHHYLAKEFNQNMDKNIADFQKIRPATKIIPGIPIQTYQGNWQNSSGIVILTPPDDSIPMVGYKRPAFSHSLVEDDIDHTLGFPYTTEDILRNQGGKPSFSNNEFYRSLSTIHARHIGDMPDMSRKEWLENFYDRHAKPFMNIIKSPIILDCPFEKMAIANNFTTEDTKERSLQFNLLLQLRQLYQQETQHFPNAFIRDYYNQLFDTVLQEAVTNKESLSITLFQRKQLACNKKLKSINQNKYHENLSIPESYAKLFAANGRKYRHIEPHTVYQSNETLLQGVIARTLETDPHEEKTLSHHQRYYSNFTALEFAHAELQARCGNIVGIYMNPNDVDGLIDGVKIYLYCTEILEQELPIIIYHETLGKVDVMDWNQFDTEYALTFDITYSLSEDNEIDFTVKFLDEDDEMKSGAELTPTKASSTRLSGTPPRANKNTHSMSPLLLPGAAVTTLVGSTAPVINAGSSNTKRQLNLILPAPVTPTAPARTIAQPNVLWKQNNDLLRQTMDGFSIQFERKIQEYCQQFQPGIMTARFSVTLKIHDTVANSVLTSETINFKSNNIYIENPNNIYSSLATHSITDRRNQTGGVINILHNAFKRLKKIIKKEAIQAYNQYQLEISIDFDKLTFAPAPQSQNLVNLFNLFSSPQLQNVMHNTSVNSSSSSSPNPMLVTAPSAKRVKTQQLAQSLPTPSTPPAPPTMGMSFGFFSMQMSNNNSNSIFNSGVGPTFNLPPSFLNFLPKPQ